MKNITFKVYLALIAAVICGIFAYLFSPRALDPVWFFNVNAPWIIQNTLADWNNWIVYGAALLTAALAALSFYLPRTSRALRWLAGLTVLGLCARWLGPLALCLIFMTVTAAGGLGLLRLAGRGRLHPEDPLEPLAAFIIGLGLVILEMLVLSYYTAIRPEIMLGWLMVKAWLLRGDVARILRRAGETVAGYPRLAPGLFSRLCLALTGLFCVFALLQAFIPPTECDTIASHLAFPKMFCALGRFYLRPSAELGVDGFTGPNPWYFYPLSMEIVFTWLYGLGGAPLCQIFQALQMVLVCHALIQIGRRGLGPRAGIMSALVWASVPRFNLLAASTHIEINQALFCVTAFGYLLAHLRGGAMREVVLMAVALAMALGTKALAGYWVIAFTVVLGVEWVRGGASARRLKPLLIFLLVAGILGSSWYLRNLIDTGNPLFPANKFIDLAGVYKRTSNPVFYFFDITFRGKAMHYNERADGTAGFTIFMLLAFIPFFRIRGDRARRALAICAPLLAASACHAIEFRYALPLFTVAGLGLCVGFERGIRLMARPVRAAFCTAFILLTLLQIVYFRTSWSYQGVPLAWTDPAHQTEAEFYADLPQYRDLYLAARATARHATSLADRVLVVDSSWKLTVPYFQEALWYVPGMITLTKVQWRLDECRKKHPDALENLVNYLIERKVGYLLISHWDASYYRLDVLRGRPEIQCLEDLKAPAVYLFKLPAKYIASPPAAVPALPPVAQIMAVRTGAGATTVTEKQATTVKQLPAPKKKAEEAAKKTKSGATVKSKKSATRTAPKSTRKK